MSIVLPGVNPVEKTITLRKQAAAGRRDCSTDAAIADFGTMLSDNLPKRNRHTGKRAGFG